MKILTLISLVLAVCFLPACGNKSAGTPAGNPTESPAGSQRSPESLIVWVYMKDTELAALQTVVNAYQSKTGDTVTVINFPYFEMLSKVEIAFPAGEGPDLVEFPHTDAGVWSQAGLIVPFPTGALSDNERSLYQASALDAFTTDGQLYGIPQIADTVVLMYNKALVTKPPETMGELVSMAHQLTRDDIYGFLVLDNNMWFSWCFISGYGGYIFGQQNGAYNPDDIGVFSKDTADGMNYLMTFRNQEGLIPSDLDWNIITGKFTEGKVAMMLMNANQAGIYQAAGVDVGIAVIPRLPNGEMPHPLLNVHGWGLNAYSTKQQAASELAVYLGAHLPVPLFQAGSGNIPVRNDVLTDPIIANNPDATAAVQQVQYAQPVPNIPEMSLVWTPLNNAFDLVASGKKTTAQALLEATQAIRDAIAGQQ
jgi:arabinogalactan oligomer/maltooligosaccharide transport system substrate-binding protein